jgi:hypothetical protein
MESRTSLRNSSGAPWNGSRLRWRSSRVAIPVWLHPDLEAFRQQILAVRGDLVIQEQIGQRLVELYRNTLKQ